jgi:hypothetical protein
VKRVKILRCVTAGNIFIYCSMKILYHGGEWSVSELIKEMENSERERERVTFPAH